MKKYLMILLLFLLAGCSKKEVTIEQKKAYVDEYMKAEEHLQDQSIFIQQSSNESNVSFSYYYLLDHNEKSLLSYKIEKNEDSSLSSLMITIPDENKDIGYQYVGFDGEPISLENSLESFSNFAIYQDLDLEQVEFDYEKCSKEGNEAKLYFSRESTDYITQEKKTFYFLIEATYKDDHIIQIDTSYFGESKDTLILKTSKKISYEVPDYQELYTKLQACVNKDIQTAYKIINGEIEPVVSKGYEFDHTIQKTGQLTLKNDLTNQYTMNLDVNPTNKSMKGHVFIQTTSNYNSKYIVLRDYQAYYDNPMEYHNIQSNLGKVEVTRDQEDPTVVYFNTEKEINKNTPIQLEFDISFHFNSLTDEYGYIEKYNAISLGYTLPILAVYENGQFIAHPMVRFGEPAYSDMSDYDITINVPKNYMVAGTGNMTQKGNTYHFKANCVRDIVYMISDQFVIKETNVGNTTIKAYGYNEIEATKLLNDGKAALSKQNNRFVKYPYDTLSIVGWGFNNGAGGKEYPQVIQIGMESNNLYNVIYHEIAHQYFYNIVGNDQYKEAWLDESIASYVTSRRMVDDAKDIITKSYDYYVPNSPKEGSMADVGSYYTYCIYSLGDKMFYELEDHYGMEKMNELLRTYILTFGFENAKSEDLVYLMKDVLGEDCYSIISPYIEDRILYNVFK